MRTIQVSDAVWGEIAKRGKFGEEADDVLRRVFDLPPHQPESNGDGARYRVGTRSPAHLSGQQSRRRIAKIPMTSFVRDDVLVVEFHGGPHRTFRLPERSDKERLRNVRDQAVRFAKDAGASYGQEMAVKKALTEAGYHLIK